MIGLDILGFGQTLTGWQLLAVFGLQTALFPDGFALVAGGVPMASTLPVMARRRSLAALPIAQRDLVESALVNAP